MPRSVDEPGPIRLITTREETAALAQELLGQSVLSCDTEGYAMMTDYSDEAEETSDEEEISKSPVDNGLALSIQFTYRRPDGVLTRDLVINYGDTYGANIYELEPVFKSGIPLLFHNAPHDVHTIWNHGIVIPEQAPVWDTMPMIFNIDQNRKFKGGYGLKALAHSLLKRKRYKFGDVFGSVRRRQDGQPYASGVKDIPKLDDYLEFAQFAAPTDFADVEANGRDEYEAWRADRDNNSHWEMSYWGKWYNFCVYACNDTWDTYSLYELCRARYERFPWGKGTYWDWFTQFEACTTRELIIEMERKGMLVDRPWLRHQKTRCDKDIEDLMCQISEWAGCPIEINKAKQLAMLLHGTGHQPIYRGANKYKAGKKSVVDYYITGKGIPVLDRTKEGDPQTSEPALQKLMGWAEEEGRTDVGTAEDLDQEIEATGLGLVLKHKKALKQRSAYLEGMVEMSTAWQPTFEEQDGLLTQGYTVAYLNSMDYGVLHPTVRQIGASSGRWSVVNPAMQTISTGSKDRYYLRDSVVAPPGWVIIGRDYSNLEYRLLAHFTNDPILVEAFTAGHDMHSLTAYNVWPEVKRAVDAKFGSCTKEAQKWIKEAFKDIRDKRAKIMNFEIIYGVGPGKLAAQLHVSKDEGRRMLDGWFRTYNRVKPWQNRVLDGARANGYVKTLMGRYRFADMDRLNSNDKWIRGEEERTLVNAVIQGSAADITKKAMLNIARSKRLKELRYYQIMQVHDEILGYCPAENAEEVMKEQDKCIIDPFGVKLRVPFPAEGDYGVTWMAVK